MGRIIFYLPISPYLSKNIGDFFRCFGTLHVHEFHTEKLCLEADLVNDKTRVLVATVKGTYVKIKRNIFQEKYGYRKVSIG